MYDGVLPHKTGQGILDPLLFTGRQLSGESERITEEIPPHPISHVIDFLDGRAGAPKGLRHDSIQTILAAREKTIGGSI